MRDSFLGGENGRQEFFESGHLLGGTDGDTDPGGEMVAAKGADDEAVFLQSEEYGVAIADFDHDKVGGAWDEAEIEFF